MLLYKLCTSSHIFGQTLYKICQYVLQIMWRRFRQILYWQLQTCYGYLKALHVRTTFQGICTDVHEFKRTSTNSNGFTWICRKLHKFAGIRTNLHKFARVLVFAGIYTRLHVFAGICTDLHGFTSLHGFARICTDVQVCTCLHGFARVCTDLHGFPWIGTDFHAFARIRTDLQVYTNLAGSHGLARVCTDLHGFIRFYRFAPISKDFRVKLHGSLKLCKVSCTLRVACANRIRIRTRTC